MIINITYIQLGGVNLQAIVFTLTSHCWLRQEAPRWDTTGRDITDVPTTVSMVQTMHEEITLTPDRHDSVEVIPSMWSDAYIFQAVLLEQGEVLLTAYPHNRQMSYYSHHNQGAPQGPYGTTSLHVCTRRGLQQHWSKISERYITSSQQCQPQGGWECTIGWTGHREL